MTVVESVFVDTNTLVYGTIASAPWHDLAAERLRALRESRAAMWISRQILREYLAVLTRPQAFAQMPSVEALIRQIQTFERMFHVADDGPEVTAKLLVLLTQTQVGGKQIHDANIVATMQVYGVSHLLTNNISDFARFRNNVSLIPLQSTR